MDLGSLTASLGVDTRGLSKAEQAFKQLEADSIKHADAIGKSFTKAFKVVGIAAAAGMAAVGVAFAKSEKVFSDFETALADMGKVTDRSFGKLRSDIMGLPADLGSATELMKGYYNVISAGVEGTARQIETLTVASKAAKAAHMEQGLAIAGLTSVMDSYKGKIDSVAQAADLLFTIEKQGKTTVAELIPYIGQLTSVSSALGVSQNEMGAAFAQVTKLSGGTAFAATQYRSVLVSLMKPSESLKGILEELGGAQKAIQKLGFAGTLKVIQKAAGGSVSALSDLLGSQEALLGFLALSKNEFEGLTKNMDAFTKSTGASEKAWQDYQKTWASVKETFENTIVKLAIRWVTELAPDMKRGLESLTDWLNTNKDTFIEGFRAMADSVGFLAEGMRNISRIWLATKKAYLSFKAWGLDDGDDTTEWQLKRLLQTREVIADIDQAILALDQKYAGVTPKIVTFGEAGQKAGNNMMDAGKTLSTVVAPALTVVGKVAKLTTKEIKAMADATAELSRQMAASDLAAKTEEFRRFKLEWLGDHDVAIEIHFEGIEEAKTILAELDESLEDLGSESLFEGSIFGDDASQGIQNTMKSLEELLDVYAKIEEAENAIAEARDAASAIEDYEEQAAALKEIKKREVKLAEDSATAQLGGYRQLFGTVKGLFAENSRARQVMHMAEMAFAVAEMAIQAQKALVQGVGAVLTQGQGEPYTAWARIAAMAGVVAGFLSLIGVGFGGGGGGGGGAAPPEKLPTTILGGDAGDASSSIAGAFEMMMDQNDDQLYALYDLKEELQDLNQNIMQFVVGILQGTFSGTGFQSMQYVVPGGQSLGDLLEGKGLKGYERGPRPEFEDGDDYFEWFDKLMLWIGNGFGEMGDVTSAGLAGVFTKIGKTFVELAVGLGTDVQDVLDYEFGDLELDLTGLDPSEIEGAVTNFFSSLTDAMASDLWGKEFGKYQKVGEGMFATVARLVIEKEGVLDALEMTGQAFNGTAKEAVHFSQALIALAGGFEDLMEDAADYFEEYLTEAEKLAWLTDNLADAYKAIGVEMPATRQGFKDLVAGLDLTTQKDMDLYVALLAVAGATDAYYDALEAGNKTIIEAQRELLGTQDQGALEDIASFWNLDIAKMTKSWAKSIIDQFVKMTPAEITAFAAAMGISVDDLVADVMKLADIFGLVGDAATTAAWRFQSMADSIIAALKQIQDQIDKTAYLASGGSDAGYYMTKMEESKGKIEGFIAAGDIESAMGALQTGVAYLQSWYTAAVAKATADAQEVAQLEREGYEKQRTILNEQLAVARAFGSLVDQIDGVVDNITYSALNVALPTAKADASQKQIDELYTAATASGEAADYQKFAAFAQTHLTQYQARYKSSETYTKEYDRIMGLLASVRETGVNESIEEDILAELKLIDASIAGITVDIDLKAVNDTYAYLYGEAMAYLSKLEKLDIVLGIDWKNYDPTIKEALTDLLLLVDTYGWDHEYTLKFLSEVPLTIFTDIADMAQGAGWIADNSGGWGSKATIAFLKHVAEDWKFEDVNEILTAIGYVADGSGGYGTDATVTFISELMDRYGATLADMPFWLNKMGLNALQSQDFYVGYMAKLIKEGGGALTNITDWLTSVGITDGGTVASMTAKILAKLGIATGGTTGVNWDTIDTTLKALGFADDAVNKTINAILGASDPKTGAVNWATMYQGLKDDGFTTENVNKTITAILGKGTAAGTTAWSNLVTEMTAKGYGAETMSKTINAVLGYANGSTTWANLSTTLEGYGVDAETLSKTINAIMDSTVPAAGATLSANGIKTETLTKTMEAAWATAQAGGLSWAEFNTMMGISGKFAVGDVLSIANELSGTVAVDLSTLKDLDYWTTSIGLFTWMAQNLSFIAAQLGGESTNYNQFAAWAPEITKWAAAFHGGLARSAGGGSLPVSGASGGTGNFPAGVVSYNSALKVTPDHTSGAYFYVREGSAGFNVTAKAHQASYFYVREGSAGFHVTAKADQASYTWVRPGNYGFNVSVLNWPSTSTNQIVEVEQGNHTDLNADVWVQGTTDISGTVDFSPGPAHMFASMNNYLAAIYKNTYRLAVANKATHLFDLGSNNLYEQLYGRSNSIPEMIGYADGGLSRGPDSGHWELLHGDEFIIPVNKLNGGSTRTGSGRGEEVELLKEQNKLLKLIASQDLEIKGMGKFVRATADDVVVMRNKRGKSSDTRRYYS